MSLKILQNELAHVHQYILGFMTLDGLFDSLGSYEEQ
jgi:hypothetical protein